MLKKSLKLGLVVAGAALVIALVSLRSRSGGETRAPTSCYDRHTLVGGRAMRLPCPEPGFQPDSPANSTHDHDIAVSHTLPSPHDGQTQSPDSPKKL